jgi:hypothetical protein
VLATEASHHSRPYQSRVRTAQVEAECPGASVRECPLTESYSGSRPSTSIRSCSLTSARGSSAAARSRITELPLLVRRQLLEMPRNQSSCFVAWSGSQSSSLHVSKNMAAQLTEDIRMLVHDREPIRRHRTRVGQRSRMCPEHVRLDLAEADEFSVVCQSRPRTDP